MSALEANLDKSPSWRAKLFVLSPDGQWTDMGTGQAYIEGRSIILENELRSDDVLLDHLIQNEIYKK